jgi:hypothetical protein
MRNKQINATSSTKTIPPPPLKQKKKSLRAQQQVFPACRHSNKKLRKPGSKLRKPLKVK